MEKWLENNGEELAKLTANVTKINNLVNTISEEAATTISDAAILAELKTLPATVESLETLQSQIGNATAVGSILYRLAEIETWKDDIVGELLGGTGYDSFASICQKIDALEQTLNGSGTEEDPEANPGIQAQMDEIRAEMAKFDMIQSVVYLPNLSSTEEGGYLLKSSVLKVYNENAQGNDKYVEVAQGIETNEIRFRVSPASKAADFVGENPKYELTFDGEKLKKSGFNAVKIVEATSVDEATGIITYRVKTNMGDEDNETWAVCAVIKAVTPQEGEAVDNTNLTTTYFTATKVTDKVRSIKVVSDNGTVASMPYENPDGTRSSLDYTKGLKVIGYSDAEAKEEEVDDMQAQYGVPTVIDYNLSSTSGVDAAKKWFEVNNGILTIKEDQVSNAMIDRDVTVTPSVMLGSVKMTSVESFAKVTITRRVVEHVVTGTKIYTWNQDVKYYALSEDEMDAIIKKTDLSRGDFNELVADYGVNVPALDGTDFTLATGKDLKAQGADVKDDNTLYIVVPAEYNIKEGGHLEITLREKVQGGEESTTKTDSYVIKVDYGVMQYPVTTIQKNPQRWTEDGETIEFRPQINFAPNTENIVQSMDKTFDAKDLFADYKALMEDANKYGFDLMVVPTLKAGVTEGAEALTYEYDPDSYKGENISFKIYLAYGDVKVAETSCTISVRELSGTWTGPTETTKAVDDLSKTYNIAEGAKWTDVNGYTMWENGKTVETGQDKDGNWLSNFKDDDPFTVYGMEKPTFAVVDADGNVISDKYVVVSNEGVVSFTPEARQIQFAQAYTVTIRVIATSPWGTVSGMEQVPGEDHATEYYQDLTFTINQGAK